MIQLSSIKQVGQGVYKYLHRWVNRNWDGKVSAEDFIGFIDCGRGLNGYLRKGADEGNYRLADIEWAKSDDSPYAKSEKDKQRLNEVFQSKCRIVTSYGHGE